MIKHENPAVTSLTTALNTANVDGMAMLLREPVPWCQLIGEAGDGIARLIRDALHGADTTKLDAVVRCITLLLDRADEDGVAEAYAQVNQSSSGFKQPVLDLILYGYKDLLLRYITNGFDPEAPQGPGGKTAIEMTGALAMPDMVALMQSAIARKRIDALITALPDDNDRANGQRFPDDTIAP